MRSEEEEEDIFVQAMHVQQLWAKIPPFSEGLWKRCRPRACKTARGPQSVARGPRAVLQARGRHLWKSPEEKGGILTLYTGFAGFSTEYCL